MEDKGKGFSLRQKKSSRRPPISAPKKISSHAAAPPPLHPNGVSDPPARAVTERPKLGGNISDLVKRRYSTRFTHLPDFSNADAPPIPKLPDNGSIQQRTHAAPVTNQRIAVDISALRDPDLQAEHCKISFLLYFYPHKPIVGDGVFIVSVQLFTNLIILKMRRLFSPKPPTKNYEITK